ncbi:Hsp20/alpha crystallin family protein [Saliphagus sp. LR7]|uniref:Hsp20/alpha crystallin family protein n=1 Tax=Saliphagus sp. LR7 TaxID=2282654 RepID=UPI000DF76A59|nr:Hsp20/alpha crystallin family protein [Saliphagus sp. LR7]
MRSFDDMDRLFDEMNRTFEEFRTGRRHGMPALEPGADTGAWGTEADGSVLHEEDGEYVFVMDLPGFEREEIDLTFEDGTLSIDASHDVEEDAEGHHAMRSRRIARSVSIPGRVGEEGISASYRNGVLEVRLPVEDGRESGHHIEIE